MPVRIKHVHDLKQASFVFDAMQDSYLKQLSTEFFTHVKHKFSSSSGWQPVFIKKLFKYLNLLT